MDEIDCAQRINDQMMKLHISAIQDQAAAGSAPSRFRCVDCDEEIPEARRKAQPGCKRCVECQELSERGLCA